MKQYLCHLSTQIFIRCDHVLQRVIVTRKISQLAWRRLLAQQCKCNSCHGPGWVQSMLSLMPLMSFSFHVLHGARFFSSVSNPKRGKLSFKHTDDKHWIVQRASSVHGSYSQLESSRFSKLVKSYTTLFTGNSWIPHETVRVHMAICAALCSGVNLWPYFHLSHI